MSFVSRGPLRLARHADDVPLPVLGSVSPAPAAALLAALAAAALLADRVVSVAAIAVVLLLVCLHAPAGRRRLYLVGALGSGLAVFVLTPFVATVGWHVIWSGPTVPVLGQLDITREELRSGSSRVRLTAVALAFAAYALLLDHDRLVQAARFARRSVSAMALATRLVPTLERDAAGLVEALRGRGVEVTERAAGRDCSGRSWPARSSGRSTSPRRWSRAATDGPGRRGPRPRLGPARSRRAGARRGRSSRWGAVALATVRDYRSPTRAARGPARRLARARAGRGGRAARAVRRRASRPCCARSRGSCRTSTAAASRDGRGRGARHAPRPAGRPRRHGRRRSSRTRRTRSSSRA